jgi:hypothetical protein
LRSVGAELVQNCRSDDLVELGAQMDVIPEADRRAGYVRGFAETGCRLSCFDQCLNRYDAAIPNREEIALMDE